MLDRNHYATKSTDELQRIYRAVEDRSTRAMDMQAAMIDCFQMQEINAVLAERGALK